MMKINNDSPLFYKKPTFLFCSDCIVQMSSYNDFLLLYKLSVAVFFIYYASSGTYIT